MRYKFRGKDQRGQWHYGSLVMGWMYDENKQPEDTAYIQHSIHHAANWVDLATVGQYTGLNDRYDKEIYESDDITYNGRMLRVVWDSGRFLAMTLDDVVCIDLHEINEKSEIFGNPYGEGQKA
ncbi:YopX family protein [Paenibacillus senegalimassiliensis]|uniref:YopX family protein n=1 Tax=Paenibacillus senegalimassiliensis TaxID=1737426 RepID=UPI00073F9312|nr:YopX family protein [Paenibacillus senegalimassiliensis]